MSNSTDKNYEFFNDMPPEEILKRVIKLPIVEPTEKSVFNGFDYDYSNKIIKFVKLVYSLGLTDELSGASGNYERNKLKRYGIDSLSIYDILVLISNGVVHERICVGAIMTHVKSGCFKEWVLRLRKLASQISKEDIYTKKGGKVIYGLRKDLRRYKPLFNCKFTYAQTMPDIPHFYVVISKESEKKELLFDRFKKYPRYYGTRFIRKDKVCGLITHENYYYRVVGDLLFRIPTNIKTLKKDLDDVRLDYTFGSPETIIKNWKNTVTKIKKGEILIPEKYNWRRYL